jgi:hypothetical protein
LTIKAPPDSPAGPSFHPNASSATLSPSSSTGAADNLTDELPVEVQVVVPKRSHVPRIDHPPTKAFRFDE